jgi:DNA-binding NarL/FixJ family response regulator
MAGPAEKTTASGERIRVLIAEDQRMFREFLSSVLEVDCDVVAEVDDVETIVGTAIRTKPHVILLDIMMPGIGGLGAAHELARKVPGAKILVLSQYRDEEYVIEAFSEAGVAGYLLKTDAAAELLPAIRAVHSGLRYISPSISHILLGELKRPASTRGDSGATLTKREREVLRLIAEGATTKDVAERLKISPKTAQVHRDNLKQKLNLHSTAAIVRYAIAHKVIRAD